MQSHSQTRSRAMTHCNKWKLGIQSWPVHYRPIKPNWKSITWPTTPHRKLNTVAQGAESRQAQDAEVHILKEVRVKKCLKSQRHPLRWRPVYTQEAEPNSSRSRISTSHEQRKSVLQGRSRSKSRASDPNGTRSFQKTETAKVRECKWSIGFR